MLKCLPAWCMLARLMIKRHYKSFVNDIVLNSNREALYGNNTLLFYSLCWLLFYCCLAEIKRRRKRKRISFILKRHFRSPTFNFSFLRLHCFTFRFFVHCSNSQRRFCLDNFFFLLTFLLQLPSHFGLYSYCHFAIRCHWGVWMFVSAHIFMAHLPFSRSLTPNIIACKTTKTTTTNMFVRFFPSFSLPVFCFW